MSDTKSESPAQPETANEEWPVNRVWLPEGVIGLSAVSPELQNGNAEGEWWVRESALASPCVEGEPQIIDPHPDDKDRAFPVLVAAAMIVRNDHVLLERRAPSGVEGLDFMWDLPGGKVECGETPKGAVVREIQEELGVEIVPLRMLPDLDRSVWKYGDATRHWIIAAFECELAPDNEPTCGENLKWFDLAALPEDEILTADLKFIQTLTTRIAAPSSGEVAEGGLQWGEHQRNGGTHTEWHAPCGCAFHPEPFPHVHPCSDGHKRPDLHATEERAIVTVARDWATAWGKVWSGDESATDEVNDKSKALHDAVLDLERELVLRRRRALMPDYDKKLEEWLS